MKLDNGRISERQCFRIGVLENIPVGIVVIPFITANVAGRFHFPALVLGLIFTIVYGFVIFFLTKAFPEGFLEYIGESLGIGGKIIEGIYILRYAIKGSLIILFFGSIIQEYMLRSFNLWWIIVPFVLISGYGGTRDVEKRGRLLELLFWWMIVPIVLVAVFSISNIDWKAIPDMMFGFSGESMRVGIGSIFLGAYIVLVVMSTMELMIFTLVKQKKNHWENALKTLLWVIIAIIMAHIFIQGILGSGWAGSESTSVLSVMEASTLPGGAVERLDYPVLAFWIIGVFAVVSGYMFYSKELINHMCSLDNPRDRVWSMPVVIILFLLGTFLWGIGGVAKYLTWYIVWFDVALSIFIPGVVWLLKQEKTKAILRGTINKKSNIVLIIFALASVVSFSGCRKAEDVKEITKDMNTEYVPLDKKQSSLENRDYVVKLKVSDSDSWGKTYELEFEIADLSEYKGQSKGSLKTKEYSWEGDGIRQAEEEYFDSKERELDLGHISQVEIDDDIKGKELVAIVKELKSNPSVPKSVKVKLTLEGREEELLLRDLIKKLYSGENSI